MQGKRLLFLLPFSFLLGSCGFLNKPKTIMQPKEDSLAIAYENVINTRCHFKTIRDWILYGYAISPYTYKEKFFKLQQSLADSCLNKPVNNFDRGILTGSIVDKEESCLGFTELSAKNRYELAKKLYEFVKEKVNELCD
jgi:hypothetical protein